MGAGGLLPVISCYFLIMEKIKLKIPDILFLIDYLQLGKNLCQRKKGKWLGFVLLTRPLFRDFWVNLEAFLEAFILPRGITDNSYFP